jgi:hypothetical protein
MSEEKDFEEKQEVKEEKHQDEDVEIEFHHHHHHSEESDVLSTVVWAFILIWAGLVFLGSNLNWFERFGLAVNNSWAWNFTHFGVWNLIALGAGVILIVESAVRLAVPELRHNMGGALIGGVVLIAVGMGGWFSWSYLWPLILIAVGINVLVSGLTRKKK